ncbi:hypothetical protein, partial [Salmonella enterica]|uniref:hypothetical protein n=1 Tax=Salmonella enterica TaxID=28901 RepID=UPI0019D5C148
MSGVDGIQLAGFSQAPGWLARLDPRPAPLIGVLHRPERAREAVCTAEAWYAAGATHVLLEGAAASVGGGSGGGAPLNVARRL